MKIAIRMKLKIGCLILIVSACDNVKNTENFATVEGFVFDSEVTKIGIAGVQVFIESDENSAATFQTRDIRVLTDASGNYSGRVFLSFTSTGPEITDFVPRFLGDVRVAFFNGTKVFAITGLTIEVGKTARVPDVFLNEFQ